MSRYPPNDLLKVIDPVIERNAFFAHPENLLLTIIVDKLVHIRKLGFRGIIKARSLASRRKFIRSFKPPKINFLATDYTEMIDWNTTTLLPNPLMRRVSDKDIWSMIQSGETPAEWNLEKFPCHTQAVERSMKFVTEASEKVACCNSRDSIIRTTHSSRSSMPNFSSKLYFKLLTEINKK